MKRPFRLNPENPKVVLFIEPFDDLPRTDDSHWVILRWREIKIEFPRACAGERLKELPLIRVWLAILDACVYEWRHDMGM
jgi:hypothetical protein